jgi:hypothetical protein
LDDSDVDAEQHVADVKRGELQFGGRAESIGGGGGHGLLEPRRSLFETVGGVEPATTLGGL